MSMGFRGSVVTLIDLYDSEIAQIAPIWQKLNDEFATKPATAHYMDELKKRCFDEFYKIGLVARIEFPTHIAEGLDNEALYSAPTLLIEGRVPNSKLATSEDGVQIFDHERKRAEVIQSKERGEKFLGEKEVHPDLKRK